MPISSALGSLALLPAGLGFRNAIINGSMAIAQRGTSAVTLSGGGVYPVDRFFAQSAGTITVTGQQATDAPSGTGLRNSVLFTTTSANTDNNYQINYTTRLEGNALVNLGLTNGQSSYLSFWVKSDVVGSYTINLSTGYRGGSTYSFGYLPLSYTINSAGVWEYKTIFIPPYVSGGAVWQFDNLTGLEITFNIAVGSSYGGVRSDTLSTWITFSSSGYFSGRSGSNNTTWGKTNGHKFNITGIQLEANYQPTPFEQRPIGVELALCQRYYEKSYDTATAPGTVTEVGVHWHSGSGNGSGRHYVPIRFKVEKRANDYTVTTYDPAASSSNWRTNNAGQTGLQRTPSIEQKGTSGFVANVEDGGYSWVVGNTRGHWTVSADL
jgi:hypothetical protein